MHIVKYRVSIADVLCVRHAAKLDVTHGPRRRLCIHHVATLRPHAACIIASYMHDGSRQAGLAGHAGLAGRASRVAGNHTNSIRKLCSSSVVRHFAGTLRSAGTCCVHKVFRSTWKTLPGDVPLRKSGLALVDRIGCAFCLFEHFGGRVAGTVLWMRFFAPYIYIYDGGIPGGMVPGRAQARELPPTPYGMLPRRTRGPPPTLHGMVPQPGSTTTGRGRWTPEQPESAHHAKSTKRTTDQPQAHSGGLADHAGRGGGNTNAGRGGFTLYIYIYILRFIHLFVYLFLCIRSLIHSFVR